MEKKLSFFLICVVMASSALAADRFIPKRFNTVTSHDDVYPYRLNNAKPNSNKTTTSTNTINSNSAAPIGKRQVIKRTTNARAATNTDANPNQTSSARSVVPRGNSYNTARAANTNTNTNPRILNTRAKSPIVSSRSAVTPQTRATTNTARTNTTTYSTNTAVSSQRCFADYKECMETYCLREDTAYNRCYCSAKLAQIDAKYQNKIDNLIQQIVRLQYGNTDATSQEIKEYWDETVGAYTGTNPWVNLENALNIEWADTQSRVRGQNAFNTGHEYCSRHIRACSYMASNMRDAYKSEISRDCEDYEKSLQKIQDAAESVIESYKN